MGDPCDSPVLDSRLRSFAFGGSGALSNLGVLQLSIESLATQGLPSAICNLSAIYGCRHKFGKWKTAGSIEDSWKHRSCKKCGVGQFRMLSSSHVKWSRFSSFGMKDHWSDS